MRVTIYIFAIASLLVSCSSAIEKNDLDKWIRNNDFDQIISSTYKRNKIDSEKFQKIISMYSKAINEKQLISKPLDYDSEMNRFFKRDRLGYEYFDEKGNLHYSITYKLVTIDEDGTQELNFIDFRATDVDLPCIKIPSFAQIRCIYTPSSRGITRHTNMYYDSLEQIGPIELEGKSYYHYDLIKRNKRHIPIEKRKSTIVLNINNNYVKSHIDIITKDLAKIIELDTFDLAYIEDISTPKLRIGFNSGAEPKNLMNLMDYFRVQLDDKLILTPLFDEKFVPMKGDIIIGHAYEERRKIRF